MRIKNDDFDVVAKKYLNLKSVSIENGIFKDQDDNLVLIIKKEGVSKQGFGIDLLKDNEGSNSWAKEILLKASIINPINFRIIIIYHNPNISGNSYTEPNYIWSEYKNDVWKYFGSHEYIKKEKIIYDSVCNVTTIDTKERRKIDEYVYIMKNRFGENYFSTEYVEDVFLEKLKELPSVVATVVAFIWRMDSVASDVLKIALYKRYVTENLESLVNVLYTYGRLKYLENLIKPVNYSGVDSIHISDVVIAIAINDTKLIRAYLKNKPGPFSYLFANGLYAFLENDNQKKEQFKKRLEEILRHKTLKEYSRSLLNTLDNIIDHDYSNFPKYLNNVLEFHNRQETSYNDRAIFSLISLPAIAFYNLAYFDKERKTPMLPEPVHKYWDSELWHEIINSNQKREYIIDVEKVSPVLKKWMDELPEKIDLNELVESLK